MMKRNHSYEINHLNNTVTITRTFLEKASQISSEEFSLYRRFQEMGFAICLQTRRARKKDENLLRSLQSSEEKTPLIPFAKMATYMNFFMKEALLHFRICSCINIAIFCLATVIIKLDIASFPTAIFSPVYIFSFSCHK